MKILCIEGKGNKELISLEIKTEFGFDVVETNTLEDAFNYLHANRDTNIVIANKGTFASTGLPLFEFIKNEKLESALFVIDRNERGFKAIEAVPDFFEVNPYNQFFTVEEDIRDVFDAVSILLPSDDRIKRSYASLSAEKLKKITGAPFDVYIRLSQEKYVKIFNKGEIYDDLIIEKYQKKGIRELFVKMAEYLYWSSKSDIELSKKINELQGANVESSTMASVQQEILGRVNEAIRNFGVNELVVAQVTQVAASAAQLIEDSDDLLKLVSTMMKKGDYIAEHSLLISYFSGAIAQEMEWVTEGTFQKLAMAAILHDSVLTDEAMARVSSTKDAELQKFTWKDISLIRKHPILVASMVAKTKGLPTEVDTIILTHHERPDGSGFPRGINATRIQPLSAVFIIAEDFVEHIYEIEVNKDRLDDIIIVFDKVYNVGNYRKPYQALCKMIKKSVFYR